MSTHWSARSWKISRWRTEYPEEFPVTVTGKASLPGSRESHERLINPPGDPALAHIMEGQEP